MRLKNYLITEAAYPGNVGFMEMARFFNEASDKEIKEMEQIIKNEDWNGFKKMIEKVLNVKLH